MSEYEKNQNQGEREQRQGGKEGRFKGNRSRGGRPDGKKRPEGGARRDGENRYGNKNRQGSSGARNNAGGNHGARGKGGGRGGREYGNGSGSARYAASRDASDSRKSSAGDRKNGAQSHFEREEQKDFRRSEGKDFRRDGEGSRARRDERRDFRRDDRPRSHSGEEKAFQGREYKKNQYGSRNNGGNKGDRYSERKDFRRDERHGDRSKDERYGNRKDFHRDERYGNGKEFQRDERRGGVKDFQPEERSGRDDHKDGSSFAERNKLARDNKAGAHPFDAREEEARPRRYEGKPYGWRPRDEEGNPLDEEQAEAFLREEYERKRAERGEGGESGSRDGSSLREGSYSYSPYRSRDFRGGAGRRDSDRFSSRVRSRDARDRRSHEEKERRVDVSPARRAALTVGRMVRERDAFAQDLIAAHIDNSRMSKEDRGFATKLVLGVVSAQGTLDEIIDRCLNAPTDVQDNVRDALRIGVYEMYFLGKQPHAAVDEGVELVRTFEPKACGVANFALRKAASMKEEFPFGNPKADLDAFARQYAFPVWLTRRLVADLGLEAACDFMEASNEPAPLFAAVNPILATDEEVRDELAAAHGEPVPVETARARAARASQGAEAATEALSAKSSAAKDARKPRGAQDDAPPVSSDEILPEEAVAGCYRLSSGRVLQDGRVKRMIGQGKLFVSDASSQEIAHLALPDAKPGSLLEVGAGRATKTLLLQGNAARLYGAQIDDYETLDNREYKTDLLKERTEAYGVSVACAHTGDATKLDEVLPGKTFDVVFVDAPCSGLGTLRRHPEIRWRLSEKSITELAKEGLAMLKSAAGCVCVGGTLVYSTCTVTHAENNGVVMEFLESAEGKAFKLVPIDGKSCFSPRLQPGAPDAHFAVKMVRTA